MSFQKIQEDVYIISLTHELITLVDPISRGKSKLQKDDVFLNISIASQEPLFHVLGKVKEQEEDDSFVNLENDPIVNLIDNKIKRDWNDVYKEIVEDCQEKQAQVNQLVKSSIADSLNRVDADVFGIKNIVKALGTKLSFPDNKHKVTETKILNKAKEAYNQAHEALLNTSNNDGLVNQEILATSTEVGDYYFTKPEHIKPILVMENNILLPSLRHKSGIELSLHKALNACDLLYLKESFITKYTNPNNDKDYVIIVNKINIINKEIKNRFEEKCIQHQEEVLRVLFKLYESPLIHYNIHIDRQFNDLYCMVNKDYEKKR